MARSLRSPVGGSRVPAQIHMQRVWAYGPSGGGSTTRQNSELPHSRHDPYATFGSSAGWCQWRVRSSMSVKSSYSQLVAAMK